MMSGRWKANALMLSAAVVAAGAAYLWLGFDRSTYYTDHLDLRRDADAAAPREILWRDPEPIDPSLDTPRSEADPAVNASGTKLYFTRVTKRGDTDLFIAERNGSGWDEARALHEVNTLDNESGPELMPDGSLVFASDRPGSIGGLDLWQLPVEGGEVTPLGPEINSEANERGPAVAEINGAPALFFASDRDGRFDLYRSNLDGESKAERIEDLSTEFNELSPAVSPGGDFLYYASDAPAGHGGFDLYRARLRDGVPALPEHLDESVNTHVDELEPSLALEGFALLFARSDASEDQTDLRRAVSREVELARTVLSRGLLSHLLAMLPWLLTAIVLAMLLAGLRRSISSGVWSQRVATLGLLARCAALSIVAHAALLAILSLLAVEPIEGDGSGYERTRVTLASTSAARDSLANQLHGSSGELPANEAARPTISAAAPAVPLAQPTPAALAAAAPSSAVDRINPTTSISIAAAASPTTRASNLLHHADLPAAISYELAAALPEAPTAAQTGAESRPVAPKAVVLAVGYPSSNLPTIDVMGPPELAAEAPVTASDSVRASTSSIIASNPAGVNTSIAHSTNRAALAVPDASMDAAFPTAVDAPPVAEAGHSLLTAEPIRVAGAPATSAAASGDQSASIEISETSATGDAPLSLERTATLPSATTPPASTFAIAGNASPEVGLPSFAARLPGADTSNVNESEPELRRDTAPSVDIANGSAPIATPTNSPDSPVELRLEPSKSVATDRLTTPTSRGTPSTPAVAIAAAPLPTSELSVTMPALAPVLPEPGLAVERVLLGRVLDAETGEPLSGAAIRLDRYPQSDLIAESSRWGRFELGVEDIPETAAVTASTPGYTPQSLNITEKDLKDRTDLTFRLAPIDETVIAVERDPLVRHLGNDAFTGSSNSRFQRESEGTMIEYQFNLSADQLKQMDQPAVATLFKGVDVANPVFVNGERIALLERSPRDGTFGEQVIDFGEDLLRVGLNRLRIEATSRPGTDIDDFEFVNPRVLLQPEGERLTIRGRVVDAATGEPLPRARVRLDRAGEAPLSTFATAEGAFRLSPGDDLPSQLAVVAVHPGYAAGVTAVSREDVEDGRPVRIALDPVSTLVIAMEEEPVVHHLGNDQFSGRINSQFQRTSEGIDMSFSILVSRDHTRSDNDLGVIQLWVKGKERSAPVFINGEHIGNIERSNSDGSFGLQLIAFPASLLERGENTLTILSRRRTGDIDDFEFVDVRVVIQPGTLRAQ